MTSAWHENIEQIRPWLLFVGDSGYPAQSEQALTALETLTAQMEELEKMLREKGDTKK